MLMNMTLISMMMIANADTVDIPAILSIITHLMMMVRKITQLAVVNADIAESIILGM